MPQAPISQVLLPVNGGVKTPVKQVEGSEPIPPEREFAATLKQVTKTEVAGDKLGSGQVDEAAAEMPQTQDSTEFSQDLAGQGLPEEEPGLPPKGEILPIFFTPVAGIEASLNPQMTTVRSGYQTGDLAFTRGSLLAGDAVGQTAQDYTQFMQQNVPPVLSGESAAQNFVVSGSAPPSSVIASQTRSAANPKAGVIGELAFEAAPESGTEGISIPAAPLATAISEENKSSAPNAILAATASSVANTNPAVNLATAVNTTAASIMTAQGGPLETAMADVQQAVYSDGMQLDGEVTDNLSQRLTTEQAKILQRPESFQSIKSSAELHSPLGFNQPGWEQRIGERINIMIGQQIQNARILLDPPEMGALEIKIQVQNDQTNINIVTTTTQAKDVLESQIPRLREMMEAQGMNLADADVSQQNQQQDSQNDQLSKDFLDGDMESDEIMLEDAETAGLGLVDYYV